MANVFLSYDHEDLVPAAALAKALEQAGHTVWYDRHIHGGAQYSRKIEQALDAANAVIVLWSERSLDSPWVRDEAAEGRDRGKLIPLSLGGAVPPMGFRQFQTIDLGMWKGRGKVPKLAQLTEAIGQQAGSDPLDPLPQQRPARHVPPDIARHIPRPLIAVAIAILLLAGGWAGWRWLSRPDLPVVEVAASDSTPRSQGLADDLYVKLGSLAQVGEGKWRLVDAESALDKPTYVFRAGDLGSARQPHSNLILTDGKDGTLLWSREFTATAGSEADLRQQLSLTAGRVLGCALESREAGGLRPEHFKLFLNACALMAEAGMNDPSQVMGMMRTIVASAPEFLPAWRRILMLDSQLFDLAGFGQGERAKVVRTMRHDIAAARKIDPGLAEIRLAEINLLPPTSFERTFELLSEAATAAPLNANIQSLLSDANKSVGRMFDSVQSARRAAELDPLSPGLATSLIMALAYAGMIDKARAELARAERVWAGTAALRDAQWSFHLRFGDAAIARKVAPPVTGVGLTLYLNARETRSADAIDRFMSHILRPRSTEINDGAYGGVLQALGEFNRIDEAFAWIARAPTELVAEGSYLLFRPGMAEVRKDPRFMAVAGRIGLVEYWRSSGRWPDYCSEPGLKYDCRAEAAKYDG